ncbi:hypothetical protein JCM24511_02110 [Saitozyma sp. JCM 24511]|nr:hypothetical protein JCM24511_02110 [Saitozyma sp. JCM 24511]
MDAVVGIDAYTKRTILFVQMEREMCACLQWNLNIQGDELFDFEARIHSEDGFKATVAAMSPSLAPIVSAFSTCLVPTTT